MKKKVLAIVCGLVAVLVLSAIFVPSNAYARGSHQATFLIDDADGKNDGALYTDDRGHMCCDEGNVRDCDSPDYVKCSEM